MTSKSIVFLAVVFGVLGLFFLIVGAIMVTAAGKASLNETAGVTILRVSGRVGCIFGSLIVFAALGSCLYLIAFGTSDGPIGLEETEWGSQTQKATVSGPRARLRYPDMKLNENTGSRSSNTLSSQYKLSEKRVAAGDAARSTQPDALNQRSVKLPGHRQDFPRIPNRRRYRSMDMQLDSGPVLPVLKDSSLFGNNCNNQPLWIPTLSNTGSSAFPSKSFGLDSEPAETMLHRGGRVKLGSSYV